LHEMGIVARFPHVSTIFRMAGVLIVAGHGSAGRKSRI
jgi:hypothetical protein